MLLFSNVFGSRYCRALQLGKHRCVGEDDTREVTWTETRVDVTPNESEIGNDGGLSGGTDADLGGDGDQREEPKLGAAGGGGFDGDGDSDNDGIPDSIDDEDNVEGIVDPSIKGPPLHPGGADHPVKGTTQVPPKPKSDARKSISTGRTEPKNLKEQLAMEEVKSNPQGTTPLRMPKMSDDKNNLKDEDGWVKRTQNVRGVQIHYVENIHTYEVLDFKFAD